MDHDWGDVMSITTIKTHNSLKLPWCNQGMWMGWCNVNHHY